MVLSMSDEEKGARGGGRIVASVPMLSYRDPVDGSIVTVSNFYDFLGLDSCAADDDVKKRCMQMLREETKRGREAVDDLAASKSIEDRTAIINAARDSLKAENRSRYNESLRGGLPVDMHEVNEGLFLGALSAAAQTDGLRSCGISVVLTVAAGLRLALPPEMEHHVVHVNDEPEADILACLPTAFEVLDDCRKRSRKVLVHCFAGVSRSATVVIAYLMKEARARQAAGVASGDVEVNTAAMTPSSMALLADAYKAVKVRRPRIEPNAGFMRSLIAYGRLGCPAVLPPKVTYQPLVDAASTADLDISYDQSADGVEQRRHERAAFEAEAARGKKVSEEFEAAAAAMPPEVSRLLVENAEPSSVSVQELLSALGRDSAGHLSMAYEAPVMETDGVLSRRACARLRAAVDSQRTLARDSVDGGPEHQLNLSREALELLIGSQECSRLWKLPKQFRLHSAVVLVPTRDEGLGHPNAAGSDDSTGDPTAAEAEAAQAEAAAEAEAEAEAVAELREIFVRRYSVDTRPWIPFHTDAYEITVNVGLCDHDRPAGGVLLGAFGGEIRALRRDEGAATVHPSKLLHGVSAMKGAGVRYSLIIFFDRKGTASGRWAPKSEDVIST